VIEPGDADYSHVKSTYARGGAPGIIFRIKNAAEAVDALAFARSHPERPLSIRSGGHGISGRSTNDGGIVVNLSKLNTIQVLDRSTRRVRIGPGARWMEVAAALARYGWALSSGDYGGVGVGGLATAGGIGWLARKHGLTIDHLRAVEMVLATDRLCVQARDGSTPGAARRRISPRTIERLHKLKRRYDPHTVFRDNFNIAPRVLTS
jgi:FAD/FMN-containing dehydrogenase